MEGSNSRRSATIRLIAAPVSELNSHGARDLAKVPLAERVSIWVGMAFNSTKAFWRI